MDEPGRLIPAGTVPFGLAAIRVHAADEPAERPALCRPPAAAEGFGKGCARPATNDEAFAVGTDGHAASARVAIAREEAQPCGLVGWTVAVLVLQPVDPAAVLCGHHVEAAKHRNHSPCFALRERDFQRLDRPGVPRGHPEDPARLITTEQKPLQIQGKRCPSPTLVVLPKWKAAPARIPRAIARRAGPARNRGHRPREGVRGFARRSPPLREGNGPASPTRSKRGKPKPGAVSWTSQQRSPGKPSRIALIFCISVTCHFMAPTCSVAA